MNPDTNGRPPEAQPEGIEEVGAFLRRWRDPAPDPAAKAELMTALLVEMETGMRAQHVAPLQAEMDAEQAHSRAPLQA